MFNFPANTDPVVFFFLAVRIAEYIVKSPYDQITEYMSVFASMEKEFERGVFEGTYIVTTLILDEVEKLRKSESHRTS